MLDYGNHRVQKFDTNTNKYFLQFGSKGASDGQLNNPCGVTVYCDKMHVAGCSDKHISVFQPDGKICICIGSDQLSGPYGVAVSADNHLLVADYSKSCICTFTLDGHYAGKFGTSGSGGGHVSSPNSPTTDLNGFIIVADTSNYCVSQ